MPLSRPVKSSPRSPLEPVMFKTILDDLAAMSSAVVRAFRRVARNQELVLLFLLATVTVAAWT